MNSMRGSIERRKNRPLNITDTYDYVVWKFKIANFNGGPLEISGMSHWRRVSERGESWHQWEDATSQSIRSDYSHSHTCANISISMKQTIENVTLNPQARVPRKKHKDFALIVNWYDGKHWKNTAKWYQLWKIECKVWYFRDKRGKEF